MCNRIQHFKSIQLPIKWSSLSSSQYSLLSDHALWRHLHTYACSLTWLSVLNENKINTIRRNDTVSHVEKLPLNTGCYAEKIPNDRYSFSQCIYHVGRWFVESFCDILEINKYIDIIMVWNIMKLI